MVYVFFIYGLAFFLLGFGTLLYPKRESRFELARYLDYIAWFGILHGINEWLDLFILLGGPHEGYFAAGRLVTLPLSFGFLAVFGIRAVRLRVAGCSLCRVMLPAMGALLATAFLAGEHTPKMWDLWSRYLLCVPASFLAAAGLASHVPAFRRARMPEATVDIQVAATAFFLYGVVAGVVVPRASFFPASVVNYDAVVSLTGIPVQLFRTACAVAAAAGILRLLGTFHRESRRALHDSEMRLRTVAGETPIVLLITDRDEGVAFAQGKGLDALEVDPDRLRGRSAAEIFPEMEGQGGRIERALAGEHFVEVVKAGQRVLQMYFGPWREEDGELGGMIAVGLDVTEQAAAEAELDKYRQEMARTRQMTLLGALGRNMAEELGGPLGVAQALLERARGELRSEQNCPAEEKIRRALTELSNAAGAIERFYRQGRIAPRGGRTTVDLHKTAERVAAVFRHQAAQANLRIVLENMNAVVCTGMPARELDQIFFVLIQNAIDSAKGERDCRLSIRCDHADGTVRLSFADTCGGMEEQQAKHVFDPFFHAEGASRGAGLGLAVVQQIVSNYGGSIDVESTPGEGTVFRVRLPVEQFFEVAL